MRFPNESLTKSIMKAILPTTLSLRSFGWSCTDITSFQGIWIEPWGLTFMLNDIKGFVWYKINIPPGQLELMPSGVYSEGGEPGRVLAAADQGFWKGGHGLGFWKGRAWRSSRTWPMVRVLIFTLLVAERGADSPPPHTHTPWIRTCSVIQPYNDRIFLTKVNVFWSDLICLFN